MKKGLHLVIILLTLSIMIGCSESNSDYPFDLRALEKQGFTITMVKVLKNPNPNTFKDAEEQCVIMNDFDTFKEAFTITWTYDKYYFETTNDFYENHTYDFIVAVYYGHDTPAVVLHIYSGYIIRYGQPFFQLNESKLGKLLNYLEGLTYDPFVSPAW